MWKSVIVCAVVLCTILQTSNAQACLPGFSLANIYASQMVFQRAPARPRLWGYTENVGDLIQVSFGALQTLTASATMGPDGLPTWTVDFDPIDAPGPFTVTALHLESGCQLVIVDVLVGDVYICSGQSNMCHTMNNIIGSQEDLADVVNYPDVRTFFTATRFSSTPVNELIAIQRTWARPSSSNISGFSAVCWLFGRNLYRKLQRPIGLIQTCWGGTRIEAWSSGDALDTCFPDGPPAGVDQNAASALWNSMIHPFLPLPIYGAIWYQGEANQGNWDKYACALKSLISDWRSKWNAWNPEMNACFPFGVVQLAPNRDMDVVNGFPNVRWAQTYNQGYLPNEDIQCSFLAVAIDLPDFNSTQGSIHPRYKRQIADRLSLAAFNVAYGLTDDGIFQGPLPIQYSIGASTIEFTYDVPLEFRATIGFELCCSSSANGQCTPNGSGGSGGSWIAANVVNTGPQSVELDNVCQGSNNPFAVGFRYLWRESPCALEACSIYSVENSLPAPPYYLSFN